MSRRTTGSIIWVSAILASPALGQQRYDLTPKFAAGEKWAETRSTTSEMTTTVKVQQQIAEQGRQSTRSNLEVEWEALAVENGVPTAVRLKIGERSVTEMEQGGQKQTQSFPAAGSTIEARRTPDGGVEITPQSANVPEVISLLEDLFEPDPSAYPKQPVAVGESWSWDQSAVAEAFGLADDDKGSVTCTLESVASRDGRETATLAFRVELEQGQAQEDQNQRVATLTQSAMSGNGFLDIATGRLIELRLAGTITLSGIVYSRDAGGSLAPQADLDGSGRMELESHARMIGSQPDRPARQVEAGQTADFVGEYKNDTMTLTLAREGEDYAGTLEFGESKFPVRAKLNGASLTGQFQSEDNWFDFDATLAGNTLSLVTGGKTHVLEKKVTARNPLGASAPANPLGGAPTNP